MEYDCAKCSGSGRLLHYGHVMNGLCFACSGHGKVSKKPAQPSVKWKCFYECADGSVSTSAIAMRQAKSKHSERLQPILISVSTHHFSTILWALSREIHEIN
jgi:hypothetical protein